MPDKFTPAEDQLIISTVNNLEGDTRMGRFKKMVDSGEFPGRTASQIQSRLQLLVARGIIPRLRLPYTPHVPAIEWHERVLPPARPNLARPSWFVETVNPRAGR